MHMCSCTHLKHTYTHINTYIHSLVGRRGKLHLIRTFFQTDSPGEVRVLPVAVGVHTREGIWIVQIGAICMNSCTTNVTVEVVSRVKAHGISTVCMYVCMYVCFDVFTCVLSLCSCVCFYVCMCASALCMWPWKSNQSLSRFDTLHREIVVYMYVWMYITYIYMHVSVYVCMYVCMLPSNISAHAYIIIHMLT